MAIFEVSAFARTCHQSVDFATTWSSIPGSSLAKCQIDADDVRPSQRFWVRTLALRNGRELVDLPCAKNTMYSLYLYIL